MGTMARSISEWLDSGIKLGILLWRNIQYCAATEGILDDIENYLDTYGDQLSDAERKQLNDTAENIWENRVRIGCSA